MTGFSISMNTYDIFLVYLLSRKKGKKREKNQVSYIRCASSRQQTRQMRHAHASQVAPLRAACSVQQRASLCKGTRKSVKAFDTRGQVRTSGFLPLPAGSHVLDEGV